MNHNRGKSLIICDICLMNIVLLGYMGSGKSAVGGRLANLMGLEFIDLDLLIEQKIGKSISEIFDQKGAVYFRKKETEILKEVLNFKHSAVIALGGGTPVYGDNLKWINDSNSCLSVYLKISVKPLVQRLWTERLKRPLIAGLATPAELEEFIRKHLFERAFVYQQAHCQIDVSDMDLEQAALAVQDAVQKGLDSN